jgi:IS5 family transposase
LLHARAIDARKPICASNNNVNTHPMPSPIADHPVGGTASEPSSDSAGRGKHRLASSDAGCWRAAEISQSGLAHSAVVTPANVHDKHPLPKLLHGQEQRVYGDSAYASQKALIRDKAPNARDFTNQRTRRAGEVDEVARGKNRNKSKIRARVEHLFAVVKRLWGFTKVRYRGLAKNANRAFVALALTNVYLSRRRLMAQVRP